jgi:hypothetical protein
LIGVSTAEKSLRIFDADKTLFLTRESGHTEGISALCVLEDRAEGHTKRTVVSTGLDGTVMIWDLSARVVVGVPGEDASAAHAQGRPVEDGTPSKGSPASLPPLRKVLTKMDVMEFSRSTPIASPSSPRSLSPGRLARKGSRLALSASIDEQDEQDEHPSRATTETTLHKPAEPERSPSPPPSTPMQLRKQRSRTNLGGGSLQSFQHTNSVASVSLASPTTPRNRSAANNARLRRPPSVPTDLRAHALAQSNRRQSMSQANDFGSLGMSTEQTSRMLRTYRKKLLGGKEEVDLEELEEELEVLIKLVHEKRAVAGRSVPSGRRVKAKAATENDVDELSVLMERANMKDVMGRDTKVKG